MIHLRLPLTLADGGSLATLARDTPTEIGQSAAVLLATRVGERRVEPTYGSEDQLFAGPDAPVVDSAALALWEPRATPDIVDIAIEGAS